MVGKYLKGTFWFIVLIATVIAIVLYMSSLGVCDVCKGKADAIVNDYGRPRILCKEHAIVVLQTEPNKLRPTKEEVERVFGK